MDKKQLEAIAMTYLRAGAAAVAALYMADPNRPLKEYLAAGIAAVRMIRSGYVSSCAKRHMRKVWREQNDN